MKKEKPSVDRWLEEARSDPSAPLCGMYLVHSGVVRETARAKVRQGETGTAPVRGMDFSFDRDKVAAALEEARAMPGIHYLRLWLNEGRLELGDDIMLVLVGGDIRPHVIDALQALVGRVKNECVVERELFPGEEKGV